MSIEPILASRRSFLKSLGAAAAAVMVPSAQIAQLAPSAPVLSPEPSRLVSGVLHVGDGTVWKPLALIKSITAHRGVTVKPGNFHDPRETLGIGPIESIEIELLADAKLLEFSSAAQNGDGGYSFGISIDDFAVGFPGIVMASTIDAAVDEAMFVKWVIAVIGNIEML